MLPSAHSSKPLSRIAIKHLMQVLQFCMPIGVSQATMPIFDCGASTMIERQRIGVIVLWSFPHPAILSPSVAARLPSVDPSKIGLNRILVQLAVQCSLRFAIPSNEIRIPIRAARRN
jgi:hypothetical protein